jgi:hypothetical protein
MRLLIGGQQHVLGEARTVLRAGLAGAAWVMIDATGAPPRRERHLHTDRQ